MSPPAPYSVLPSDRFTNWRKRFWKAEQANDRAASNERRRASGTSVVNGEEAEPAPPPSGESDRRALGATSGEGGWSPCLHCGTRLHIKRKDCTGCGRPNRWFVRAGRERVVQLTLEAAEGGDVRPHVVVLQKSAPPTKPLSRGGQRGSAGPDRAFLSPCLHCGRQLHLCRKECECGKPNRWHVHRRRVVRLSLTVGGGGSVCADLFCQSSAHADTEAAAVAADVEEQEMGEDEDEDACTWVMCDNCEKWRRLRVSSEKLPEQWRCEMNDDVRRGARTRLPCPRVPQPVSPL